MGKASNRERARRAKQSAEAGPGQGRGRKLGALDPREKRRRKWAEHGEPDFKAGYDIKLPGGLLRDPGESRRAGQVAGLSEADLLRGLILKAIDAFGYTPHARAVSGVLAEALNAFPKNIRGNLAFALINGTGLLIDTETVTVCADCGTEQERSLAPEDMQPTEEDAEPVLLDTTPHAETCHVHRETDEEARPLREPEFKEEEAIVILTPPRYEPLNAPAPSPETTAEEDEQATAEEVVARALEEPTPEEREDAHEAEFHAEEPVAE